MSPNIQTDFTVLWDDLSEEDAKELEAARASYIARGGKARHWLARPYRKEDGSVAWSIVVWERA